MNRRFTVYTLEAECQDCYKCLRECPVKAIRIANGRASVEPERCIACGRCVRVCPAKAKKIRDDVARAKYLLQDKKPVYLCLAPSWRAEYPGVSAGQFIAAVKGMGFAGVVEAALGAQEVSAWTARHIKERGGGVWLSSACPACVEFIRQYLPNFSDRITPVASPAAAAARLLRDRAGECHVLFAGPCIAKKNEAEESGGLIELALTFRELREWMAEAGINPEKCSAEGQFFYPEAAAEGKLFPAEGGMIETMRPYFTGMKVRLLGVAGIEKLERLLQKFDKVLAGEAVFIECLACDGGCLAGPGMEQGNAALPAVLDIYDDAGGAVEIRPVRVEVLKNYAPTRPSGRLYSEERLRVALRRIGKEATADELNCGGCGYDSCRDFAQALLEMRAEPQMCVSYMRRLAQKKANGLLRSMPSGVVIVNDSMEIVECNESFAELFGEDTQAAYQTLPGLAGAQLESIVPFGGLFRTALRSGEDIVREHFEYDGRLFTINIFSIEEGATVGAVIQDVTRQELKREYIARRAREVIRKNIATVQEIACLLGEHVTDTEILLSSIADDYAESGLEGRLRLPEGANGEVGGGGKEDGTGGACFGGFVDGTENI